MKKLLSILLAATLVMATGCGEGQVEEVAAPTPEPTEPPVEEVVEDTTLGIDKDIVVLYVNDVHCGLEDNLGYQDLVTVKNAYEAMGHKVILVDNGDAIQGDIVGTLSKGEAIINIMNEAGFDACAKVSGVVWWDMNWRKGGLQPRRAELIRELGFYNQTFCGCEYSKPKE